MSVGGLLGAAAGGIIGFFIGGPAGAFMGASIGFSLGMMVDPVAPDVKSPGMAVEPLQVTSNMIGTPIPDLLGTSKITGFLLSYGLERAEPQYTKVSGGKGGGGKKSKELTGYKYYASWQLGICFGPADALYAVYKNDNDVVWEGELTRPAGGVETVAIEGVGAMRFYFGTDDQPADATVAALIGDATLNSPLKGLCCVVFDDCCVDTYNRLPTMSFVLRRTPTIVFSDKHIIQVLDYNPMHAIWYWLSILGRLPETWLHSADFASVALTLYEENRGISALLNQQQSLETYIETVNAHIDAILRYGCDGAFHPKLIRDDYDLDDLETIDETMLLDKPEFSRGSWIGTINEVKVQYSEITGRPVSDPYLIGWYKFDEGSGLTVYNHATGGGGGGGPLPNLAVVQNVGQFWTYRPGFGTTLQHVFGAGDGLIDFAWAYPNRGQIGPSGVCFGIFLRSKINPYGDTKDYGGYLCCSNQTLSSGVGFLLEHGHIYYNYQNQEKYGMGIIKTTYHAQWYNIWTFHFVDKDAYKYRIVKPDGTLWSSSETFSPPSNIWCNYLMSGCSSLDANPATKGLYPGGGSYGDWIIYSNKVLTLAEWAEWYDKLRSRYGMAARSGW